MCERGNSGYRLSSVVQIEWICEGVLHLPTLRVLPSLIGAIGDNVDPDLSPIDQTADLDLRLGLRVSATTTTTTNAVPVLQGHPSGSQKFLTTSSINICRLARLRVHWG
jgi:hypothetical protein